ncbi:MAG: PAS domain S-box protein [Desulfobacterales bacterium]|nr:MAG: PAS domain S-box protein [Desulfobacterales bacterium]
MKLRSILLILSLLAFLSASTGGFLYYTALNASAFKEAERQAESRLDMITKNLSSFLSENIKPVNTLAGLTVLGQALVSKDDPSRQSANEMLDHFNETLVTDVCYLMDRTGETIASSNRGDPDSFVGQNFAFRPYFQKAIQAIPATYLALGTASGRRGAYFSHPVYAGYPPKPVGVAVIKASIELIEKELSPSEDETVLVIDPHGVIFISNRPEWLYHLFWPESPDVTQKLEDSRQFGAGPWKWIGLSADGPRDVVDRSGERFQIHRKPLDNYPGWQTVHLRSFKAISKAVYDPLIRITGPLVLTLCVMIGISVFLLYRKASQEISHRRSIEAALRESEERYRNLYHHTPAMLHSIDTNGCIVSVSNYWSEVMGYRPEEVIGRALTSFFTDESRRYAEEIALPDFFKTGFVKDVPYQFVKKNGEIIDVLLSAIADRNRQDKIVRTLAVSIDVTERKRAEKALQLAKEALSQYSKDLERQVRNRTREVHSILKYTPSVVYMKDKEGRYILVNSRFEELFGIKSEDIKGRTDYDVMAGQVAEQFQASDSRVLSEKRSHQVDQHIPQPDGMHTYLAVKFPIYDESGAISGICSILNDITAVKKAQDQLRRLSGSIMANQEKERSAIARELHDELGQVLTALRMDAVWIQKRLQKTDPQASERALAMCQLIDKNIEDVRGMAFRLRPGVLDDLGLVDALEWYTTDFERRTEIICVFEHENVPPINDTIATAAYRITQEALTNVVRHAFASKVDVLLKTQNGTLMLSVVDNGRGFNALALAESEGLGVAGMRERAGLVGGTLEVHSQPEKGTQVFFRVPIDGQLTA